MLEKINKKIVVLYLFILGVFLVSVNTIYALECAGTCYVSGVCVNDVWYEGCEDSSGNLYTPDQFLNDGDGNDCLQCKCTGTSCEWQPNYQSCIDNFNIDYTCEFTATPPPDSIPESSTCIDRDTNIDACTDSTCSALVWTNAGEIDRSFQTAIWEYPFEVENPPPGNIVGTAVECCGDDSSENYISTTIGATTYSTCCDSANKCVDQNNICRENVNENTVALCSDGIDNNCNGLTDCQESSCGGVILGNVKKTDGNPIDDGATIEAIQSGTVMHTESTNTLGDYFINNVLCGTYEMVASKAEYISSTDANVVLPPKGSITVDFTLVSGTTCEDDCTYAGDNIIHKECDGINGCGFFKADATDDGQAAREACDLAQPGWIRDYYVPILYENHEIECAEGTPQIKKEVKAKVTCEEENLIKLTKVITYKGKLVKLVIVTCGK